MVYHTGIRPKEILALRVADINLKTHIITIAPEEGLKIVRPIMLDGCQSTRHLEGLLKKMDLDRYPDEYYAFGAPAARHCGCYVYLEGKVVRGAMRPDYLNHKYQD